MYPTVIIPTFWTRRRGRGASRTRFQYDHPTSLGEVGTLPDCLRSLEGVRGLGRVIVLVATTDESIEHAAEDQVRAILADFPGIDTLVIGSAEMGSLQRRMEQLEFADLIAGVGLGGYGGIRNVGLMIAAALGAEEVVFIDDDQVIDDPDFLVRGLEGLGEQIGDGRAVLAKSGFYVDRSGASKVPDRRAWFDMFWRQTEYWNHAVNAIAKPPRMKPATIAFGGCLALHRDMYCNVPFDPWTVRGEDVDYVINARMHGGDVFMDSGWSVIHQPPQITDGAALFRQDVLRFIYTHRKLEFAKSQVDLRQVTADSLEPYPGRLVDSSVVWRSLVTALFRAMAGPERGAYLAVARRGVTEAQRYARENCERYFVFGRRWPMLMDRLWEDVALKSLFTGERRVDRGAITGRFPVIRAD